jgi:hypothetical protein
MARPRRVAPFDGEIFDSAIFDTDDTHRISNGAKDYKQKRYVQASRQTYRMR